MRIGTSMKHRPIVIGAGIGGLCAALDLAVRGYRPIVLEKESAIGGKMVPLQIADAEIDGGPTVLTMTWVFEELFARAGVQLSDFVTLTPAKRLARHFWQDGSRLDLFADLEASRAAIEEFAGHREADGFIRYHRYAQKIFENVNDVFIRAPKPTPFGVMRTMGMRAIPQLLSIDSQRTMWRALGDFFKDERLKQLFGRYATYSGNNPFATPATFNLIAHVEQDGVWRIQGGMSALANAIGSLIETHGGEIRTNTNVRRLIQTRRSISGVELGDGTTLNSPVVVFNGDVDALGQGLLGLKGRTGIKPLSPNNRSLSAVTLCCVADVGQAPLIHHNVFFSRDYEAEFRHIDKEGRLPDEPTIYICAQDRGDEDTPRDADRLLMLINAPGRADVRGINARELKLCVTEARGQLERMGLSLDIRGQVIRGPNEWNRLFPGSGGAIYGAASKKWNATLKRHGATTKLKGLYLTGGSIHPGAGVPMAALSGRTAAAQVEVDFPNG